MKTLRQLVTSLALCGAALAGAQAQQVVASTRRTTPRRSRRRLLVRRKMPNLKVQQVTGGAPAR